MPKQNNKSNKQKQKC